ILQNRGEARQVLEQALEISEAVWGGEGIELVDPLMALGGVSTDLRQIDDARNYYERALRITRKQQEPDSLVEGIILLSLVVSNYNERRLESIRQLREAREILSKRDGSLAEIRLATADLWIGTHHVASGRHREAIGPLLASLDTFNQYAETR